jgi:hypothetical protein
MKHKPKNKMQYDKHIKAFINKGYRLKSILMTRRILCTGYYYNKKYYDRDLCNILDKVIDKLKIISN